MIDKCASRKAIPPKITPTYPMTTITCRKTFGRSPTNNSPMPPPKQHRGSRAKLVPEQEPFETVAYVGLKNLVYPHPRSGSSGSRLQITPSLTIRNPNSSSPRPQRHSVSDMSLLSLLYIRGRRCPRGNPITPPPYCPRTLNLARLLRQ